MAALEFFLTRQVYSSEMHSGGWDKHVYDDENIHYYLLQALIEGSSSFVRSFLDLRSAPSKVRCTIKPAKGIFDMLVEADAERRYIEVKIWARFNEEQLMRQVAFLREHNARGVHLLLTKAADKWPPELVKSKCGDITRVLGTQDLLGCLRKITSNGVLAELAIAYSAVLNHLERRWPSNNTIEGDAPQAARPSL
jgi:hypothetical protein